MSMYLSPVYDAYRPLAQTYISYGVRRAQKLDDASAVDPLAIGGPGALLATEVRLVGMEVNPSHQ
jgi:hypothetical protein